MAAVLGPLVDERQADDCNTRQASSLQGQGQLVGRLEGQRAAARGGGGAEGGKERNNEDENG